MKALGTAVPVSTRHLVEAYKNVETETGQPSQSSRFVNVWRRGTVSMFPMHSSSAHHMMASIPIDTPSPIPPKCHLVNSEAVLPAQHAS